MKTIVNKRVMVVKESNAEAFESALNRCFSRFIEEGVSDYDLRFNDSLGLCAYIVYDEVRHIPETLQEVARAEGRERQCADCVHFVRSDDARRKYHICGYDSGHVREDKAACNSFYKFGFNVDEYDECGVL